MDVIDVIDQRINNSNGGLNIAVAGATCSGKTTLACKTKELLVKKYSSTIIHQDDYFKDLNLIPHSRMGYLMDSVNAFEIEEFREDIKQLLNHGSTLIPRYDINQNKRLSKDIDVVNSQLNIFEGLHVIYLLNDYKPMFRIFIDADLDVCLARRIKRDVEPYNISEERIREYFNNCMIPMYKNYIMPQINDADMILDERGAVKCLLKK